MNKRKHLPAFHSFEKKNAPGELSVVTGKRNRIVKLFPDGFRVLQLGYYLVGRLFEIKQDLNSFSCVGCS